MRPYLSLFATRARTLFSYRMAAFAGLTTQWVFGFILISVLVAFYGQSGASQPMTLQQAVTYTWLGQAMLGMVPWNMDSEIANSVRDGSVAYDLARPLDLYAYWFARAVALRTAPTLLKSIPIFLTASLLLPEGLAMQWPSLPGLLAWLLAVGGALILSCTITLAMQASYFWTIAGDGVSRLIPSIVSIFSGMIIPLPLFPDWMQGFLRVQPFTGVMASPALLFCGAAPPSSVFGTLALQLGWAAVFCLIGRLTIRRGMRRLTVAGG